jgi:hypothetical protein
LSFEAVVVGFMLNWIICQAELAEKEAVVEPRVEPDEDWREMVKVPEIDGALGKR